MAPAASICYDRDVKLTRTEAGYVVEVPEDVVVALGLQDGDPVALAKLAPDDADEAGDREPWGDVFRRLARPLPAGYTFDRGEANAR